MIRVTAMDNCIRIACDADRRSDQVEEASNDLSREMVIKTVVVDSSLLKGNKKKEAKWL